MSLLSQPNFLSAIHRCFPPAGATHTLVVPRLCVIASVHLVLSSITSAYGMRTVFNGFTTSMWLSCRTILGLTQIRYAVTAKIRQITNSKTFCSVLVATTALFTAKRKINTSDTPAQRKLLRGRKVSFIF